MQIGRTVRNVKYALWSTFSIFPIMALWWCVPVSGTAAGTLVSGIPLLILDMSMKI